MESSREWQSTTFAEKRGLADWLLFPLRQSRPVSLLIGGTLIAAIAVADWRSADDVPLGFLYLLPMLIVGRVSRPWLTLLTAGVCMYLTEKFDPFAWNVRTGLPRDFMYYIAFSAIGLFVYHSTRNRSMILWQMAEIEKQSLARLEAEQQLAALIETSPATIVTTDLAGKIVAANDAAHRLLQATPQSLAGRNLSGYFPSLQLVIQQSRARPTLRTVMQSRGVRANGESFVAEVCFSTYDTAAGPRFTAMILDASDEFRSREEASLHQILSSSRLAVSAMSHEIRNISGAIAAVHRNMRSREALAGDQDFDALGNLVVALERIATIDLRPSPECLCEVTLDLLLADLRIVVTPDLEDQAIETIWQVEPNLPAVWADPTSLMQVFLNLTTNSIRALSSQPGERTLTISARTADRTVIVEILDNGGGIGEDVVLFRPFQAGAQQTGLGLYLARAFARSFGGDLQHRSVPGGASFSVTLEQARIL
jgi:two-component system sensor kinase FixL